MRKRSRSLLAVVLVPTAPAARELRLTGATRAETIDLAGRFVLPGLIDAHVRRDEPAGRHRTP